ncbi:toxin YdaT family protein [Klebsiella pneumoniae]|uniref:toxin YdaT family protein n=1 Tax=Klebsiella pneumoniae TaxID=573 RepID=UPI000A173C18|nr:toxin YdaT family protein [Klebsiella pneumoniae]OSC45880.1 hypothetical protein B4U19_22435 [Klebsiella pneumoniae]
MENIEELKREIFSWAAESGQELVAIEISRMWFRLGGNTGVLKLHQIEDADGKADWRAINNNRQQIFLAKAMEAALPAERYARLDMSTQYLICVAIREFAAAIIALLLEARDGPQQVAKALQAMRETQRLTSA